jgi:hypothetical protein
LETIKVEPRIVALMVPLQRSAGSSGDGGGGKRDAEIQALKEEVKRLKANPPSRPPKVAAPVLSQPPPEAFKGGRKGRGKRGGKSNSGQRMPRELIGLNPTYKGARLCFDYNLIKGCSRTVDSMGACSEGKHLCMRCGGNHAQHYAQCPGR